MLRVTKYLVMLSLVSCVMTGCAGLFQSAAASGPRGHVVTTSMSHKCGYRITAHGDAPDRPLPAISMIWVGCNKISASSDVAYYLRLVSGSDDRQRRCTPTVWGVLPVVLGVAADGKFWAIHLPVGECGVPKAPALEATDGVLRTGHLVRGA